jgi:HEAT repeat protein
VRGRTRSHGLPLCALAAAALAGAAPLLAQPTRVDQGRTERRPLAAGLERGLRELIAEQRAPAWIGYAVPRQGRGSMCCHDGHDDDWSCCGRCRLEQDRSSGATHTRGEREPARLEPADALHVLLRVEAGRIGRLRAFSAGCALDVGGLPLYWLEPVGTEESLALLASLVGKAGSADDSERSLDGGALTAIAHHAGPGADARLESFAAPGRPEKLRKQAVFWMGVARGRRGYETLSRLVRDDAGERFREHCIFALSQSEEPEAVERMFEAARRDASSHVRGQALFWLAQKAGHAAAEAITRAIEDDPETEVKKKAVFALSQLPRDRGVPLLIQTARGNRNPAVRKQAMFWLGQSNDPRAVEFFQEVLLRR